MSADYYLFISPCPQALTTTIPPFEPMNLTILGTSYMLNHAAFFFLWLLISPWIIFSRLILIVAYCRLTFFLNGNRPNNIPLCAYTTLSLTIHLSWIRRGFSHLHYGEQCYSEHKSANNILSRFWFQFVWLNTQK